MLVLLKVPYNASGAEMARYNHPYYYGAHRGVRPLPHQQQKPRKKGCRICSGFCVLVIAIILITAVILGVTLAIFNGEYNRQMAFCNNWEYEKAFNDTRIYVLLRQLLVFSYDAVSFAFCFSTLMISWIWISMLQWQELNSNNDNELVLCMWYLLFVYDPYPFRKKKWFRRCQQKYVWPRLLLA